MTSLMVSQAEKLAALRAEMVRLGLDGFIVPRTDAYQGEYVAPCDERLAWLTGFTGSAGAAVVLRDKAVVLSDGRYTIQLAQQCDGALFETGDSLALGVGGWLSAYAESGAVIGYDPWLHTPDQLAKLDDATSEKGIVLKAAAHNLVDLVWRDRPAPPCGVVEIFPEEISGKTLVEKKKSVCVALRAAGVQACVITLPDSVSWLLNVRGADVESLPVVQSFALVFADEARPVQWIVNPQKLPRDILSGIKSNVEIIRSDKMLPFLMDVAREVKVQDGTLMLDFSHCPQTLKGVFEDCDVPILNQKDPSIALKAIKTPQERAATQRAHLVDGVALAGFLCWLESAAEAGGLTELDIEARLLGFRAQNPAFRDNSFSTIAGFGEHGAIVHYRATPETNKTIGPSGVLLIDSGAQYGRGDIWGTTDITRTVAVGAPTPEMREHFTLVLKGHIAVARARFPKGTCGAEIDALARAPLQGVGLDYAHGTGHGVGCYLSVHEEAASLSPRGKTPLEAGMLISNEPGYYKTGAYGIRIENLVFVTEGSDGLLGFETVSFAPIDQRLIVAAMLTQEEKDWLNAYHAQVYAQIAPKLDRSTAAWLLKATHPLL